MTIGNFGSYGLGTNYADTVIQRHERIVCSYRQLFGANLKWLIVFFCENIVDSHKEFLLSLPLLTLYLPPIIIFHLNFSPLALGSSY